MSWKPRQWWSLTVVMQIATCRIAGKRSYSIAFIRAAHQMR